MSQRVACCMCSSASKGKPFNDSPHSWFYNLTQMSRLVVNKCVLNCQHAHVSRGEVIGLLGGTFIEEEKVLKVRKGVKRQQCGRWGSRIYLPHIVLTLCVCADLCSRAMQQREHRTAVWDGSGVSDSGLWRAVGFGLQCGGLVPLTSLLSPQPFSTWHQHAGPVPGNMSGREKSHARVSPHEHAIWFCPDCSRVISHVVEPPSSGW